MLAVIFMTTFFHRWLKYHSQIANLATNHWSWKCWLVSISFNSVPVLLLPLKWSSTYWLKKKSRKQGTVFIHLESEKNYSVKMTQSCVKIICVTDFYASINVKRFEICGRIKKYEVCFALQKFANYRLGIFFFERWLKSTTAATSATSFRITIRLIRIKRSWANPV